MTEQVVVPEPDFEILEKRTEKIGIGKRRTFFKVRWHENILEEKIDHYAKPIAIIGYILDTLIPAQIIVKTSEVTIKKWKLPFQQTSKIMTNALTEVAKLGKEGKDD